MICFVSRHRRSDQAVTGGQIAGRLRFNGDRIKLLQAKSESCGKQEQHCQRINPMPKHVENGIYDKLDYFLLNSHKWVLAGYEIWIG
jgi:hypothetical protein